MTCDEATSSIGSDKWIITMEEELKLMQYNEFQELVGQPKEFKLIGCNLAFKTKKSKKNQIVAK